jgi:hypothetical protein
MRNGVGGPEKTVEAGGGEGAHALRERAASERASERARESRREKEEGQVYSKQKQSTKWRGFCAGCRVNDFATTLL